MDDRSERLLVRSETLERVTDGVVSLDADLRYTYVNRRAAEILGVDRTALLGTHVWDAFPGATGTVVESRFREAMGAQRSQVFERYDERLDCWFEVRVYPDEAGLSVCFTDVTDRVAQRQRLDELNEEYEALFSNAADAIFLLDVDGDGSDAEFRFHRLNPAHEAATGLTTGVVWGKTPREALGERLGAELTANYRRCLEAGRPITYEERLEFPAGRSYWETSLAPVGVDGEVTRIVGIARETTERVERERELEQQNERLDEFANVVSHDLRGPLTVASGYLHLLSEECDPTNEEALGRIADALNRMEEIVEDTLTLARDGDTVVDAAPVSVTDLATRSWGFTDTADARLVVDEECTVLGDASRLQHLFQNLFRNAVEHGSSDARRAEGAVDHGATDGEPPVTVRVGRFGTDGLYVADDGPGVPAADREAVFETGYTTTTEGTGFGLAIVRRTAASHGWSVRVTEGPEGGARFEFTGVTFA
jgi:PAS domain S-box-containing protein